MDQFNQLISLLGGHWSAAWPYVTAIVTIASIINNLPAPAAGSHWLPVRKVIAFVALAIGGASQGSQPPLGTWLLRIVQPYLNDQGLKVVAAELADMVNKDTNIGHPATVDPATPIPVETPHA